MTTGEKIKKGRQELGLSQKKFGEQLGISQNTVAMIEGGYTGVHDKLKVKISKLLNQDILSLFFENIETESEERTKVRGSYGKIKSYKKGNGGL